MPLTDDELLRIYAEERIKQALRFKDQFVKLPVIAMIVAIAIGLALWAFFHMD